MEETNKRKTSNLKIGSILIIVFILIYIPSLFHWIYGIDINTDIIRSGNLEVAINTDSLLVRDEQPFYSPNDGTYIPEVGEGEKIPVNFTIATVLKRSSEGLLKQLKEIDLNMIKAQKKQSEKIEFFSEDINKIESDITDKLKLIIAVGNSNNIDSERDLHDSVDLLIQKKTSIIGNTSTSDAYINSLKNQKDSLENRIKLNTSEISSKASGIVSFTVDGYENQVKPETIKSITPEFLDSIKAEGGANNINNKIVEANKPFGKVIKNFEYHVVSKLNKSEIKNFKQGDKVEVRMNEINKTLIGNVDYISPSYSGKYIISIKLDQYISDVAALRIANIDLVVKHYAGLKVPVSSLKDVDFNKMKAKIVIVDANYATIKEVSIVGNDSEFAIIDNIKKTDKNNISLYDIYVVKPGNIKEGQIINQ